MKYIKIIKITLTFTIVSILLCACHKPEAKIVINTHINQHVEISEPLYDKKPDSLKLIRNMLIENAENFTEVSEVFGVDELENFFDWFAEEFDVETLYALAGEAINEKVTNNTFHELTGYGIHSLYDIYSGHLDPKSENYMNNIYNLGKTDDGESQFGFVGDVMFGNGCKMMRKYDNKKQGILGILDKRVVEIMSSVDIMTANNEFVISDRGSAIPGKAYTFRANPLRANIWHEMGVDIVSLANNHVYDYGEDAFLDTLDTLDAAGVKRIGAGKNIEEASKPVYYIVNGYKVALLAATRAEKTVYTPKATETKGGVMYTYNSKEFCEAIKVAKSQSDFVIVNVHWGYEMTTQLEDVQISMGKEFIDSGADLIVGHHAHTLQSFDSYKGKIICYNLGNFLFNSKSEETGILIATINNEGELISNFVPCYQQNVFTRLSIDDEYDNILNRLRSISLNVNLSENGIITAKTES